MRFFAAALLLAAVARAEDPHALVKRRLADGERRWVEQDFNAATYRNRLVTLYDSLAGDVS